MRKLPKILVIDDDPGILRTLALVLSPGYSVHLVSTGEEGLRQSELLKPDLVLLDLKLPGMGGLAVLRALKKSNGAISVIILTAYGKVDSAVQAIKLGAVDYLEKPLDNERLRGEVDRFFAAKRVPKKAPIRDKIIGESPAIQKVWRLVEQFGPTDIPILLQGETGTGKELFARALHEISKRSQGPLVSIDCSALPEELMESELFGYEKGAFTGAYQNKPGRVLWANGGSLFLDEISVLPLSCQAKLLRLVEEQGFVRLGTRSSGENTVDVRIISATNVRVRDGIQKGLFRADLYHRLNGLTIELPPLRNRGYDVELLVRHFLDRYRSQYNKPPLKISPGAMDILRSYSWPGNVRELQRVMAAAALVAGEELLSQDLTLDLPEPGLNCRPGQLELKLRVNCDLSAPINLKRLKGWAGREVERRIIREVQKKVRLNRGELAHFLGVDPKTLRSRLKEMGKEPRGKDEP